MTKGPAFAVYKYHSADLHLVQAEQYRYWSP